ncbi:hypothetical protein [Nostoc sp. CCY0012]|uniref:hypothetical protein n=1 Tax=Nostoc sp. CCY0012 TaxID=1056123 RepID=UPI0039C65AD5
MTATSLPNIQKHEDIINSNSLQLNLQIKQEEAIYNYLVEIVNTWQPHDVLREFKRLFIDCLDINIGDKLSAINIINYLSDEYVFRNTVKRSCYILVNNWASKRKHKYIQELINLFTKYSPKQESNNHENLDIYKNWLKRFVSSKDYEELKLFANKYEAKSQEHWSTRYTAYLLVAQSFDINNSLEQQEAARILALQMKERFKFELAMYIARSQSTASSKNRYKNPSILGDNVLRLIKMIIVKKGVFSYENIAHIFIKQTQNQNLKDFKDNIIKYLFFSVRNQELVKILHQELTNNLSSWKIEHEDEIIHKHLLLRICNRVIDSLTINNNQEPAPLFILLLSQGHALTLVILLLKIILICKNSRSHLEVRIANLISYYQDYSADECKWLINFIEIFNITFAIYAENVDYNLIKMPKNQQVCHTQCNLEAYRVFSQLREDI